MEISNKLIQSITEELKNVVNQDINYFNKEGFIVASTDRNRIGAYHEGAKIVLETKKELSIDSDYKFEGSRRGINLPVYLNGQVVGAVGITGEEEEVKQYGKIIQKITQILLKDAFLNQEKVREKESRKRLLEEMIYNDDIDLDSIKNWFKFLKIEEDKVRTVVMFNIVHKDYGSINNNYLEEIVQYISRKILDNKNNLMTQMGKDVIMSLEIGDDSIESIVSKMKEEIESKYRDIGLIIGVGTATKNLDLMRDSYLKSELSLDIMRDYKRLGIKYYDELDLEVLFKNIDEDKISGYLSRMFKDLSGVEIKEQGRNFFKYVEANGSINRASEELFIHKNTLQYRLDNIYKLTGYNPRCLEDMISLYIAFKLFDLK